MKRAEKMGGAGAFGILVAIFMVAGGGCAADERAAERSEGWRGDGASRDEV